MADEPVTFDNQRAEQGGGEPHVSIETASPKAGPPLPPSQLDSQDETKSGTKWLIVAFVLTAIVCVGLFVTVFVLQATSTANFEEWKTIMNATLKQMMMQNDIKMQKIQNELDEKSKEIDDINQRNLPIKSCDDASRANARLWDGKGGIFDILRNGNFIETYCDATTDGGRWTTFQRRKDGSVDFYRTWEEYADGFGKKLGEFWFGLKNIYQLTQDGAYELRVDLTDWDGSTAYAEYGTFSISGGSDNYRLTVGQYSGTAGDALANQDGLPFSAKNKDLDKWRGGNCAHGYRGAWWYNECALSSLNGIYNDTSHQASGVYWHYWIGRAPYSLKGSEMKFRKK